MEENKEKSYCLHDSILNPIGSEWRKDECTSCRCSESAVIECFHEHCDKEEVRCTEGHDRFLNIKGQCCPVCSRKQFKTKYQMGKKYL